MTARYLLYGSERYAPAILRPLQAAIRAAGAEVVRRRLRYWRP